MKELTKPLNNETVISGLFVLAASLLTLMIGLINKYLKSRKNKRDLAYEKHTL